MRTETEGKRPGFDAPSSPARSVSQAMRLDWLDPVKALALLAILLNHLVEEFGPGPWFTNPSNSWPSLAVRLHTMIPPGTTYFLRGVRTLGWLGDAAPGVFILASGVGLTLSALASPQNTLDARTFYRRRVLRLYPLYIAMHFVVLAGALLVPGDVMSFAGLRTALSLTGVRWRAGLFFYISPSWWFVWLILQLYVVYPFLFRALRKLGPARFFLAALAFTIASRAIGLTLPDERYAWLTGRFFGSRLAEFAAGMVLAQLIFSRRDRADAPAKPGLIAMLGWSVSCYALGLFASFWLVGALVSNLLVTIGMTGLFWVVWQSMLRPVPQLASASQWLGRRSYAVFLLHQPPLQWTAAWFMKSRVAHLAAAIVALIASVPAAAVLEDAVSRAMRWRPTISLASRRVFVLVLSLVIGVLACAVLGRREVTDISSRATAWVCAACLMALLLTCWSTYRALRPAERLVALTALFGGALELFGAPGTSGAFALGLGFTGACVVTIMLAGPGSLPMRVLASTVCVAVCAVAGELALRRWAPLETRVWGELPALQAHPTRAFSLIPARVTRLHYNNYDYTVRTNSLGLTSPEIPFARPTPNTLRIFVAGDAFAMPEGLEFRQSFPALLNEGISRCLAPRPVQIINGGVTGYGPNEELAQMRELVPEFHPDIIIDQFYINEFSDISIPAGEWRHHIGLDLATRGAIRRYRDRSQILERVDWMKRAARESLNNRPSDWRYNLAQLQYYQVGENPLYDASTMRAMTSALAGMKQVADANHARFLIVFVPGSAEVLDISQLPHFPRGEDVHDPKAYDLRRPYNTLRSIADSLGIQTLDLTADLRASTHPAYFSRSWHWTADGHRAAAASIQRTLDTLGMLGTHCQ
jgi:peptidoglycan/LPS O-acetylase OafA/YrhL